MIKAFVDPTPRIHSPAMVRIANALTRHAPSGEVEIVSDQSAADVVVLYAIGSDYLAIGEKLLAGGQQYAVVQCCLETAGYNIYNRILWLSLWQHAVTTWSYYNLPMQTAIGSDNVRKSLYNFYYAPLGLDSAFLNCPRFDNPDRERLVITTGHVTGPRAEAIEEVWTAAHAEGYNVIHLGASKVVGLSGVNVRGYVGFPGYVPDHQLAVFYSRAKWVASLRHVEGFELPAAEGLACGARPLLFAQPDLRHWYGAHACYVPDLSGEGLTAQIRAVLRDDPEPVTPAERTEVLQLFNWRTICEGFWSRMLAGWKAQSAMGKTTAHATEVIA